MQKNTVLGQKKRLSIPTSLSAISACQHGLWSNGWLNSIFDIRIDSLWSITNVLDTSHNGTMVLMIFSRVGGEEQKIKFIFRLQKWIDPWG